MKTNILGLRTAIFQVPDLAAAKQWYAAVFEQSPYFDEPFYVGFNIDGFELGLLPEQTPIGTQRTDNVLVYWGVEDIHAQFNRIVALGATVHETPSNVGGEILVATVRDPWNNVFGLIYSPDFKLPQS